MSRQLHINKMPIVRSKIFYYLVKAIYRKPYQFHNNVIIMNRKSIFNKDYKYDFIEIIFFFYN